MLDGYGVGGEVAGRIIQRSQSLLESASGFDREDVVRFTLLPRLADISTSRVSPEWLIERPTHDHA